MKHVCFLLRVQPERLEEYLQAHQVWPEMLDAMHNAGIRNYSMFYRKDGLLVGSGTWVSAGQAPTDSEPLQIGRYHTYAARFLGDIDEVGKATAQNGDVAPRAAGLSLPHPYLFNKPFVERVVFL